VARRLLDFVPFSGNQRESESNAARIRSSRYVNLEGCLVKKVFACLALAPIALVLAAPAAQAQAEMPEGVTQKMVSEGEAIYKGAGTCFVCHGPDGTGIPSLGADLTDDEWTHGDGSYLKIVETILKGAQASTGAVMPPKGGPNLSDAQVKAVAAYVWSLRNSAE
jgi:mono/diheme cytochrome c family protein